MLRKKREKPKKKTRYNGSYMEDFESRSIVSGNYLSAGPLSHGQPEKKSVLYSSKLSSIFN
jgi:hypothetical protein